MISYDEWDDKKLNKQSVSSVIVIRTRVQPLNIHQKSFWEVLQKLLGLIFLSSAIIVFHL